MCQNANLIVTARKDGKLVGVARSLTDFIYCTYLSDLAVDKSLQKRGIGTRLIKETKLHSPQAKLILSRRNCEAMVAFSFADSA